LDFVAILWPLYPKWDEMPRREVKQLRGYKFRYFRSQCHSGNFTTLQSYTAWGARGPEFKSRRSDQSKQSVVIEWLAIIRDAGPITP
jgi:hypothetical protein